MTVSTALNLDSPSMFIGKQGDGIISFGSGQPDLPPPKEAVEGLNIRQDLIYERQNYIIKGSHVITVNSFSKTYAMCEVRVGYPWSPDQNFVNSMIEIKTHTSMNTNLVGQDMALRAMSVPRSYIEDQLKIWHRRRDLIYNGLVDLGLDLWKPEGAFYVLPLVPHPRELVMRLVLEHKVIVYLSEWFGAPDRIRLSYALEESEILEGLNRIGLCLKEIRSRS